MSSLIESLSDLPPASAIVPDEFSIAQFLAAEQEKDLLRFSTAGSVDDGKSTLIGRLLYDSQNVYEDHVRSVTRSATAGVAPTIDFALLTDGLRAEREQGITIDVAYRYFATARRKFIIADTPGHEQYTRNMATGASTAHLAIVLVDARKGILIQSRRHTYIASLLGIPRVVAAINKMDLVDYSEEVFEQHRREMQALADRLEIPELVCIPVSALEGDNVVTRSERMPWYPGPSLLEHLEQVPAEVESSRVGLRLPVQRVIRPDHTFRGFAGQIAAGTLRPNDKIVALPSGVTSRVKNITTFDGNLDVASAPQSVVVTLQDEVDISRGDMIAAAGHPPAVANHFQASLVWLHAEPLDIAKTYLLKHTSRTVKARLPLIIEQINMATLEAHESAVLGLNGIGVVEVETSQPLMLDTYRDSRRTGSFIVIDPANHATVGAGMVRRVLDSRHTRDRRAAHTAAAIYLGCRAELALALEEELLDLGCAVVRTRVTDTIVLQSLLRAGVIVLVENAGTNAPRIAAPGDDLQTNAEAAPPAGIEIDTLAAVDSLLTELRERHIIGVTPSGEDDEYSI
jgi:sulfate adenylyltransferase large subunit